MAPNSNCGCLAQNLGSIPKSECESACGLNNAGFSNGFWRHSPGCSMVVSGNSRGKCHFNTNATATWTSENTKPICGVDGYTALKDAYINAHAITSPEQAPPDFRSTSCAPYLRPPMGYVCFKQTNQELSESPWQSQKSLHLPTDIKAVSNYKMSATCTMQKATVCFLNMYRSFKTCVPGEVGDLMCANHEREKTVCPNPIDLDALATEPGSQGMTQLVAPACGFA